VKKGIPSALIRNEPQMGLQPGLPDGLFLNQIYQFGYILEGLRLDNVNIFYGHLEYFMDIRDIL
jgi:hypothetical protein